MISSGNTCSIAKDAWIFYFAVLFWRPRHEQGCGCGEHGVVAKPDLFPADSFESCSRCGMFMFSSFDMFQRGYLADRKPAL